MQRTNWGFRNMWQGVGEYTRGRTGTGDMKYKGLNVSKNRER